MQKGQENGAVLYVRVSTDEQANGPLNLGNQEKRCREYCKQQGWPVMEVFVDPGESARSVERPEFQRMLAYCRTHRSKVRYVVVQDLSRFARNNQDQAQTISELGRIGVLLRSTYESNIDETAAGKLAANIFGTFNQYFSDALSEKMRDRTRQSVSAGRFPWRAPIGYQNIGGKDGPNIKPDEKRAPLIRQAFELVAAGQHKQSEVLQIVTDEGLITAGGRPLPKQTFQAVLRNPLYAGFVTLPSDPNFEAVRGLHEPIVSQEVFDRVQAILDGRRPSMVPKKKVNPLLPLKCFVRCDSCGTPLTGGLARGRTKKYPRYWCRKQGCRAVKLSSTRLEDEFLALLGRLRANPETVAAFPKMAARVWEEKQGGSERESQRLRKQLEEQKRLKSQLLKMRMQGELSREEFEQANADFAAEIYAIEDQLLAVVSRRDTADSFVRFAELQLMDIANSWRIAAPDQRQRVQNLLFEGGLDYSPNLGILNRSNSSLFSVLEAMNSENGLLVGPEGFEPPTKGL
jgi:site-specific DNA recombinase